MKLAITSTGENLESQVDPRFGRCQYFIIVELENMQFEAVQNPNIQAGSGAGIATAQMIAQKGAEVVVTGNIGPNAYQTLSAGGVKVVVGASGTVKQAIEQYKQGKLQLTSGPSVGAHSGMGGSSYQGRPGAGPGMGAGRGMGRGMGMRPGMGAGMGFPQTPYGSGQMGPTQPQMSREQELSMLKKQTQEIEKQLDLIKRRIKNLEKG